MGERPPPGKSVVLPEVFNHRIQLMTGVFICLHVFIIFESLGHLKSKSKNRSWIRLKTLNRCFGRFELFFWWTYRKTVPRAEMNWNLPNQVGLHDVLLSRIRCFL